MTKIHHQNNSFNDEIVGAFLVLIIRAIICEGHFATIL
jgi:hypothetical protein